MRHIAVNELWLQEQVHEEAVTVLKIKNKFHLADLLLLKEYLSKDEIQHIVDFMKHSFLEGRSAVAPAQSLVQDDNASGIVHKWHGMAWHEQRRQGPAESGVCSYGQRCCNAP